MFDLNNISRIKGYYSLTNTNKEMFTAFLKNFINAWGLEARETIEPVSVKYCKDNGKTYLRFDYKVYNRKDWLHVTGKYTWY